MEWLEYAAEGLHTTLNNVWTRIQRLTARTAAKKIVLRPKQERLLHMLRDRSSLTPKEIWEGLDVSKQGAMDLLNPLIEAGLVKRVGTKKQVVISWHRSEVAENACASLFDCDSDDYRKFSIRRSGLMTSTIRMANLSFMITA